MKFYKILEPLILASASPRRKELLENIGILFSVQPSHIIEVQTENETPREMVLRLAAEKAEYIAHTNPEAFIYAVDTDVILADKVFGKPNNFEEAEAMISQLSGKTHSVFTAGYLIHISKKVNKSISTETKVTFRKLTKDEIYSYVRADSVLDKAGAYGAQNIGLAIVERIEGSFSAVMGLDLAKTVELFLECGVIESYDRRKS